LGNDFFQRWLDPQMMYSSAIYPREDATLDEASIHKLWTVCRKLKLSTGDHLLEIGTGWGAMAIHAAQHFGCRVTTATISQEQFALARERVAVAGLSDRVEVVLCDYRELSGSYDKLVSIEMIEAVGDAYLDTFFSQCSNLLKPNGVMLLQAITCPDQVYEQGKHTIEFVKRHIFPGGQVPSVARMMDAVRRKTDLRLEHAEDFGRHYARTLLAWRDNFQREVEDIRAMGYPETFLRMWEYYLSYCAGGFTERQIGVCHLVLSKPDCRAVWGVGDSPALAE
jgi:cyclopropane-fatty-acyl-phospholipid synthase